MSRVLGRVIEDLRRVALRQRGLHPDTRMRGMSLVAALLSCVVVVTAESVPAYATDLIATSVTTTIVDCATRIPSESPQTATVEFGSPVCVAVAVTASDESAVHTGALQWHYADGGAGRVGLGNSPVLLSLTADSLLGDWMLGFEYDPAASSGFASAPATSASTVTVRIVPQKTSLNWGFCQDARSTCWDSPIQTTSEYWFPPNKLGTKFLLDTTSRSNSQLTSLDAPLTATVLATDVSTGETHSWSFTVSTTQIDLSSIVAPGALPQGVYALTVSSPGTPATPQFSISTRLRLSGLVQLSMAADKTAVSMRRSQADPVSTTVTLTFTKAFAPDQSAVPTSIEIFATQDIEVLQPAHVRLLKYYGLVPIATIPVTNGIGTFTYSTASGSALSDDPNDLGPVAGKPLYLFTTYSSIAAPTTYATVTPKQSVFLSSPAMSVVRRIGSAAISIPVSSFAGYPLGESPDVRIFVDGKDTGISPSLRNGMLRSWKLDDAIFRAVGALTPGEHSVTLRRAETAGALAFHSRDFLITLVSAKRAVPHVRLTTKPRASWRGTLRLRVAVTGSWQLPGSTAGNLVPHGSLVVTVRGKGGATTRATIPIRKAGSPSASVPVRLRVRGHGVKRISIAYSGDPDYRPVTLVTKVTVPKGRTR